MIVCQGWEVSPPAAILNRMQKRSSLSALAVALAITLLFGWKSRLQESRDQINKVTIDLNKTAPIGYEICADRPTKLSRENLELQMQMPAKLEIPPDQQEFGAQYVEFRP